MEVYLPKEIAEYEGELRFFFDLMVRKLQLNRHKGFGEHKTLEDLMTSLKHEQLELATAIGEESQFAVALEAADVANFAFLVALKTMRLDKAQFESERHGT